MRKFLLSAAALAMVTACAQQPAAPPQQTQADLVARGQYLVNGIGGCNDCHTPMTAAGPDIAHSLQGAPLAFRLMPELEGHVPWAAAAPQIAGGPADLTDDQFVHLLMSGEKPDGSRLRPPMPQFRLNEEDARAVVAYIKTVPRAQ
jgi:mono/diheme cytochrome c family protein